MAMIAAAYRCGDIIFWDSKQGVILKQIKDPANHDIVYLKFFRSVGWHNFGGTTSTLSLADSDSVNVLSATPIQ
jgi:O-glycosyl hydrolase